MEYRLGQICKFQSGGTPAKGNPEYFNGNIPWITTTALNGSEINDHDAVDWITEKAINESAAKIVPANSIMVGTRVGVGKVAINKVPMSTSQDIISLLDIAEDKWDKDYLCKLIQANNAFLNSQARGATIKGIKIDVLADLKVPEIPLEKQRKVSDVINKTRGIIDQRQKELESLDELIKARFVEMFGDTVINPKGWNEHRLDEYITFLTSGSRGWAQYFTNEEDELFITIKNVKNNHITLDDIQYVDAPKNKEAERTKVKTGDLLISITADLGRTGVVDDSIAEKGAYINQHLSLVRLNQDKINPLYVSYFLETSGGKRQFESKNQNGVKAGLNFEAIKSLKILVPPIERQEQYLDFVKQVDKSKVAVQKSLDETQRLFDSLMQEYFG